MVLVFYHFILLSMFLFSLLWQKWASIHFLITVEEEKRRLTEEQPGTVTTATTKKKQQTKKTEQTSSARHRHNAICSTCIQLISAPNPSSISATYAQNTSTTQLPVGGVRTYPVYRFGDQVETKRFHIYKGEWKTEDPKIADCAFDYLGFIWRRVAAVRP